MLMPLYFLPYPHPCCCQITASGHCPLITANIGSWNIFLFTLTSYYPSWIQHIPTGLLPRLSQVQGMVSFNISNIDYLCYFDNFDR